MKLKLIYNLVWLQFSVQMNRWAWSHNKGCYGHVRTKDMIVKQLCVCVNSINQTKQPAVCELAKLDMDTFA